jgi:hypothetical protein
MNLNLFKNWGELETPITQSGSKLISFGEFMQGNIIIIFYYFYIYS